MKTTILFSILFFIFLPTTILAQQQQDKKQIYSGTLWGWGGNWYGQLGNGSTASEAKPTQIGNDCDWISVACYTSHTFAIKKDGTLWGWGLAEDGCFGAGYDSTFFYTPKQIGTDNNWKQVYTSDFRTIAIKNDGSLWVWGCNHSGILGDTTLITDKIYSTPIRLENNWNDVIFVSANRQFTAVLRASGTLYHWGFNKQKRYEDGSVKIISYPEQIGKENEWLTVSCGVFHTLAIKKDGTLWGWGSNTSGVFGKDSIIYESVKPFQIGTDNNWISVTAYENNNIALKKDGTLWTWGCNIFFGLGDSTKTQEYTPQQIGHDRDWVFIAQGEDIQTAIKKDGSLWAWGVYWIDGDGVQYIKVPTKMENITGVNQVAGDHLYSMFIKNQVNTTPIVSTLPIKILTYTTAESGGNITSDGGDKYIKRGICYSMKPYPKLNDSITDNGRGPGEFQSVMENLTPFQTYYVRAYATNTLGTSYGLVDTFKITLQKPILKSPENNKTEVPLNSSLKWNSDEYALIYHVQIATSPTFDSPLIDEEISGASFDYNNYENNTNYYWRVQAKNGSELSEWSVVWSFTTLKFNPQVLLSPTNDAINAPIDCKLVWKQNSPKTSYILQVSKKNNFSSKEIFTDLADTFYICDGLKYLGTYFWRVSAVIGEDQSDWSPVWKFTTLMDSVNLSSPADLSINMDTQIDINWEKGIYKKDYRLQISEANNFASLNKDTLVSKINNADLKNLNFWQKYFWRVRNESGDTLGYWSKIWQFKTRMSDILLIYPANTQTGLGEEINFKWDPVVGAEYYQLQISKNNQFTDLVYSRDSIPTTEHYVPDLEKDILYYWRVRVWNSESIGTAYWSEVWTFRTGSSSVSDGSNSIQIIPNPAGDFITIRIERWSLSSRWTPSGTNVIQIYNTLGEKVLSVGTGRDLSVRINISALLKGMYFVRIGGETAKFIKM